MTVFVSSAVHEQRLAFGSGPPSAPGLAAWASLAGLYRTSLDACGRAPRPLLRPEIYQTPQALRALGASPGNWHLAVKPIGHLRPFHGIPNVFVCDWAFPELSTSSHGVSPFLDQVRLLHQADAVACCTDFTADTLRRAGVERVVTLPPAIPVPPMPPRPVDEGVLFVMEVEAGPSGGLTARTIAGFVQARAQRAGLRLLVRLHGPAPAPVPGVTFQDAALPLAERPDFFLCGSAAEGLCLPLAQAMLAGIPAVTTMGAGLGSIARGVAVEIATEPGRMDAADDPVAAHVGLTCHPPMADAVCQGVLAAAGLDRAARAALAAAAQAAAERRFGLDAFRAGLLRLAALVPAVRL